MLSSKECRLGMSRGVVLSSQLSKPLNTWEQVMKTFLFFGFLAMAFCYDFGTMVLVGASFALFPGPALFQVAK